MAPIAKDNETVIAPPNAASAGNPANKAGEVTRSQPVALEIPVTVNGARTIEGSEKREPFSESTQTVLVFTNGAVIRLASALASGQLVFLTNEKTKKEVVCQVVKSKNYRTVTGYVELEFTEPAPGFWGMRFPAVAAGPAPATSAPGGPRPVPANVAPSVSNVPAAPKVVPPPPAPVAAQPISVLPPAPPIAIVTPAPTKAPEPVATLSVSAKLPAMEQVPISAAKSSVVVQTPQTHKADSVPASNDYAREIAAIFSVPQAPAEPKAPAQAALPVAPISSVPPVAPPAPAVPVVANTEAVAASKVSSTDELKLQAARLQEQLSAMLFTETPQKPASPAPSLPTSAKEEPIKTEAVAQKVLELTQADLAPASILPPAPPAPSISAIKAAPVVIRPVKSSLDSEEVQIPAWLAPLARNAEVSIAEASPKSETRAVIDAVSTTSSSVSESETANTEDASHREQPSMFGGQLLTDSSALQAESSSSGSKKGLFIGLAAAAIVLVAGAAWYSKQPGNLLTGSSSAKQVAQTTNFEPVPALGTPENSEPAPSTPKSTTVPPVATPAAQPSAILPTTAVGSASATLAAKNNVPAAHTTPAIEPPKKPTLGDVHLATPVVNHSVRPQDAVEGEPSMEGSQMTPNADSLSGLTTLHGKGPSAPPPVGGDVKQARLTKSVAPIYPSLARTQHISGNVLIDALIDAQGNVTTMKVLSGSPMLHQAALTAVKQWKYEPARLDGMPTSMHLTVTVQFRVQ